VQSRNKLQHRFIQEQSKFSKTTTKLPRKATSEKKYDQSTFLSNSCMDLKEMLQDKPTQRTQMISKLQSVVKSQEKLKNRTKMIQA